MTHLITVTLVHSALKRIPNVHSLRMAISSLVCLLHIPFSLLYSLHLFVSEKRNITSVNLTWGNSLLLLEKKHLKIPLSDQDRSAMVFLPVFKIYNLCLMATTVAPTWQLKAALTVNGVKFTRQLMLIHHVLWFVPQSHIGFVVLRNVAVINCCFIMFFKPKCQA